MEHKIEGTYHKLDCKLPGCALRTLPKNTDEILQGPL